MVSRAVAMLLIPLSLVVFFTTPVVLFIPFSVYFDPQGDGSLLRKTSGILFSVANSLPSAISSYMVPQPTSGSASLEQGEGEGERGPLFSVGVIFRHKKYGYVGLVRTVDEVCQKSEDWIASNNVDKLPRGRKQPFYLSLVDARYRRSGAETYVAEENIEQIFPGTGDFQHPRLNEFFAHFDPETSTYIEKAKKLEDTLPPS